MFHVVIDANLLISYVFARDEAQQELAETLFLRARNGELVVALPQFVIFEAIFVFRSFYKLPPHEITAILHEAITLPGLAVADDCPWPDFFQHWSDLHPDVVDAAILALAIANHYSLATFDRKLVSRAKALGIAPYW